MTNEEAIKDIKENILPIVGGKSLLMAIAALEGKDTNVPTTLCVRNKAYEIGYKDGYSNGKAEAAPKWIPFTQETAPKDGELYLIKIKTVTGSESIRTDRYSTAFGEWFIYENDIVMKWMPIPKDE